LQKFALAFASDSASAMLEAYEDFPGGEFGKSVEANRNLLLSLSKKNPENDRITFDEHKALLTARMALYVDAAVGLAGAYPGSKDRRFRDKYALRQVRLEAVATKDWRTYKDWRSLEMDSAETDAVCEVLAAYLGKDRPSR